MAVARKKYFTVEEYLADLEIEVRERLESVRTVIRDVMPAGTSEKISYNIPAFIKGKHKVFFAGYPGHVSLYPVPAAEGDLAVEIGKYRKGKGTLLFPNDEPLPLDFIRRVAAALFAR